MNRWCPALWKVTWNYTYSPFKGTVNEKNERGYRLIPENLRSWLRYKSSIWCSCLEKLIWNCVKILPKDTCKILYKIGSIKQIMFNKYATNLKTMITQRSLRNSSLLLLLFEFNNFLFLIDIIDNIIYASETCHQNYNQCQCRFIVTCHLLYKSRDQYTALP